MSLSIVIPTLNEEETLPDLLTSIRQQSIQPEEIIIADAKSTDRTLEIAREFDAKIVDGGLPSVGRNRGADVAQGDMILFLDADVILHDVNFLKKALHEFTLRHLDIATADVKPMSDRPYDHISHWLYNRYARLMKDRYAHAPGFFMLVRKSLHEDISGFDERIRFCEDHDYAHRASRKGAFGFLASVDIHVSVRRMDRDGRMQIARKFMMAEMHLLTKGPIRDDRFEYTFGHNSEE